VQAVRLFSTFATFIYIYRTFTSKSFQGTDQYYSRYQMIYDTYLLRRGKKIIKQEYSGQLTWGRGVECTTVEGVGFITGRRSMV
jgi:hypothetical protein